SDGGLMMKRLVLAGLGALAVVTMMGSANAADMPRRHAMPAKAPMYEAPYNWTGFYVGINGGGGFGHSDWSNALGTNGYNLSGAVVGGTIGYNYQMGQAAFGLEAAIAGPWTAKIEYLYVDLGKGSCGVVPCGAATDVSFTTNLVRAGVNYRFSSGGKHE